MVDDEDMTRQLLNNRRDEDLEKLKNAQIFEDLKPILKGLILHRYTLFLGLYDTALKDYDRNLKEFQIDKRLNLIEAKLKK